MSKKKFILPFWIIILSSKLKYPKGIVTTNIIIYPNEITKLFPKGDKPFPGESTL